MPIPLGILAVAGAGGGGAEIEAFEHIGTGTPDSTNTFTFSGVLLPTDYKHLQVRIMARQVSSYSNIQIRFNGDTTSTYSYHRFSGEGNTSSSIGVGSTTRIVGPEIASDNNEFVIAKFDIYDYRSTNKFKTVMWSYGIEQSTGFGTSYVGFGGGCWRSTNAISSIEFYTGSNYASNTYISLYGIRG